MPVQLDETPELSTTKDWKFDPTVASALDAAQKARDAGADIVIGVVHAGHEQDYALQNSHKFDLIVSGHDHDLRVGYDGMTAYVETSTEANYLPIVDLNVTVTPAEGDKKRSVTWSPNFRIVDTATVTPDPDTQAIVDKLQTKLSAELDVQIGTTANELNSQRAVVRGEESGLGRSDRRCDEGRQRRRCRHHQWRRYPWRQGLSGRHGADPQGRVHRTAVRQQDGRR